MYNYLLFGKLPCTFIKYFYYKIIVFLYAYENRKIYL